MKFDAVIPIVRAMLYPGGTVDGLPDKAFEDLSAHLAASGVRTMLDGANCTYEWFRDQGLIPDDVKIAVGTSGMKRATVTGESCVTLVEGAVDYVADHMGEVIP